MLSKLSIAAVMDNIIEPNSSFDFAKVTLAQPTSILGGAYFTKILFEGKALYIQTPKSSTRQGFLKTGKKIHCDLMFDNNDTEFIHWVENLETKCQDLIFQKSNEWFQNPLEIADIESAFNSPLKVYKSGKFYLVRTNVKIHSLSNQPIIKIYNENESAVPMDEIHSESSLISILEIQGIKFTSRNFQIEVELKQVMVLNKDIIFENCLIKKAKDQEKCAVAFSSGDQVSSDVLRLDLNKGAELQYNEDILSCDDSVEPALEINSEKGTASRIISELEKEKEESDSNQEMGVLVDSLLESIEVPTNELTEVNLDMDGNLETITLKTPNDVYYKLYKEAREKAKLAKKESILAFLEAKNIKKTYMLDDISESSEEENFSDMEDDE